MACPHPLATASPNLVLLNGDIIPTSSLRIEILQEGPGIKREIDFSLLCWFL